MFGASNNTPGSFGIGSNSNSSSVFGAKPATGGLFGASSNNATAAPSTGGGLFGAAPAASNSVFGQSNNNSNTNTASAFGAKPATGGLFGASAPAASTGGLFGNSSLTPSTGGLFGNAQAPATTGFGAQSTTQTQPTSGLFGAAQQPATGGLFGSSNNAQQSTGTGLFGSASTGNTGTGGLFGQKPSAPTTGGLFGTSNTTTAPATGGLFGTSNTTTAPATGGLFGSSNTTAAPVTGGLFGNSQPTQTSGLFGGQQQQQQQQQQQTPSASLTQLTAMTRFGDLAPALKNELQQLDTYIDQQHLIALTLNSDLQKHDQLIHSIPSDVNYLHTRITSIKHALRFDEDNLKALKTVNDELTEDISNIMHLIVQLSTPGTKLSSSFHLNDFFVKRIKKYREVLASYEAVIKESVDVVSGLEKACTDTTINIYNVVEVVRSQYGLFMELCETVSQIHSEVSRI